MPSDATAQVVFDQLLPSFANDDFGADRVFQRAEDVIVFAPRTAHSVSATGLVNSTPYLAGAPDTVAVRRVEIGNQGFGSIVGVDLADRLETRFCMLSFSGEYDELRCTDLGLGGRIPALTFDGTNFRVYARRDGSIHRWIIDESAAVQSENDSWDTTTLDGEVSDAIASNDNELLLVHGWHATGVACNTINEHHLEGSQHTSRSVLPSGLATASQARVRIAGTMGQDAWTVVEAVCVEGSDQCLPDPPQVSLYLMSTYEAGVHVADDPIALPLHREHAIFDSGASLVVAYAVGTARISLSRFDRNGNAELSEVDLSLAHSLPGGEAGAVFAGIALSTNEYVLVYTTTGVQGAQSHVATVRIL